jgi:beta-N-acetylhexosaminidase
MMSSQFMVDIAGTELSKIEQQILQHPNVGAVILFTRNFANALQLKYLVSKIKELNPNLFIAIDQEGGNVQRFQRQGFSSIPAAHVYGEAYDLHPETGIQLAQLYGKKMAQELLAYGIDLSIAPVLDIHDISPVIAGLDRAFHRDPDAVTALASAFIEGMNSAGMPAVGKHFPGHGSVPTDSHISMPISPASLDELKAHELKPFIELINKGKLNAVMPAHITYTAVDNKKPAGFSTTWLNDILRNELGFTGLVLSDCLSMKGADIGNLKTRAEEALQAGCDMLIVCNQPQELLR